MPQAKSARSSASKGSLAELHRAIEGNDASALLRWIDAGGDLFAARAEASWPLAAGLGQLSAFGQLAMSSGGKSPWPAALASREQALRAMPAFDPNRATTPSRSLASQLSALVGRGEAETGASGAALAQAPTPLHLAAGCDSERLVRLLLDLGADPNKTGLRVQAAFARDAIRERALPPLSEALSPACAFELLRRGARPNDPSLWGELSEAGANPLGPHPDTHAPACAAEAFLREGWRLDDLREASRLGVDFFADRASPRGPCAVTFALHSSSCQIFDWLRDEEGMTRDDVFRSIGGRDRLARAGLRWIGRLPQATLDRLAEFLGDDWLAFWGEQPWPGLSAGEILQAESPNSWADRTASDLSRAFPDGRWGRWSAWEIFCHSRTNPLPHDRSDWIDWSGVREWPGLEAKSSAAGVFFWMRFARPGDHPADRQSSARRAAIVLLERGPALTAEALSAPLPDGRPFGEALLACASNAQELVRFATPLGDFGWAPAEPGALAQAHKLEGNNLELFEAAVSRGQAAQLAALLASPRAVSGEAPGGSAEGVEPDAPDMARRAPRRM
jgi:hypothetical protein